MKNHPNAQPACLQLLSERNFCFRCKFFTLFAIFLFLNPILMLAQSNNGPCIPTMPNVLMLSGMFGTTKNTSSDLFNFRDGTLTAPNSSFLFPTPNLDWWNTFPITGQWMSSYNLFNGNTTNNVLTAQNYPIASNGLGEIFIDGDFIIDEDLIIYYSEIKMGPNARIIVTSGHALIIADSWLHGCGELTDMWHGILVEDGGFLQIRTNCKVEDALIGINCISNSYLDLNQSIFNRNKIGVVLNGPIVKGITLGGTNIPVNIERVSFTCVGASSLSSNAFNPTAVYSPITLKPPFANQHSEAGVVVNNMSSAFAPLIGKSVVGGSQNYFVNQDVGILCDNSWANIINSRFFDIKLDPAIIGSSGTGIKIKAVFPNTIAPYVKCNIGDNISTTLYDQCTFEQCNTGIDVFGNTEISIYNTKFIDDISTPIVLSKIYSRKIIVSNNEINNFYKQGVKISDCLNNSVFNISFNTFSLPLSQPTGSQKLDQTGIYIKNTPAGYSGANISNNTFTNARYGIFVNGLSKVIIANNTIHFQKPWSSIQNRLHAGIECDNSLFVNITDNTIDYLSAEAALVGAGTTIAQTLRGIILKSVSNSTISNNLITNCGRPIRCIDNLQQTYFNCNTFNGCFDSWQFQNTDISNQGGIGFPIDNKWLNYPRSINPPNQNKIGGNLIFPKLLYYRNSNTAAGNYIPTPSNCTNLGFIPTTGSGPCNTQIVYEDPQTIIDFVISDSVNVSNDSIYEVERARHAAYLAANDSLLTIPDYVFWHNILQNSETGIYARLLDSSYNRINLITDISGITNFRLPEYEAKRDLLVMALLNQTNEVDEYNFDEMADDLIPLGNTPAWMSTNVVYTIRAIYDLEVDDEELGLRMMNISNENIDCDFEIVEKSDSRTITSKSPALLEVFNVSGQLVYKMNFESSLTLMVNTLPAFTIYQLSNSTCNKTGKWQTV